MKQAAFPLFETSERGPVILSCLCGGGGREGVRRIVEESNGFYWERRISHRQQSLKQGGGGRGGSLENYIHSLREGSGKFYCGTTKIPRPHTPVISNDRSLVKLKS